MVDFLAVEKPSSSSSSSPLESYNGHHCPLMNITFLWTQTSTSSPSSSSLSLQVMMDDDPEERARSFCSGLYPSSSSSGRGGGSSSSPTTPTTFSSSNGGGGSSKPTPPTTITTSGCIVFVSGIIRERKEVCYHVAVGYLHEFLERAGVDLTAIEGNSYK